MLKKFVYLIVFFLLLLTAFFFLGKSNRSSLPMGGYCAFCDATVLERQKFYEDDLVMVLYTHKPIFPGHCLVIPKRHVERFEGLSQEEASRISQVIIKVDGAAKKVFGTSAYLLLQKNGREVGQAVPHVHVHYIPRKTGDDSSLKFLLRMFAADAQKPIAAEKMQEVVMSMREAMEQQEMRDIPLLQVNA